MKITHLILASSILFPALSWGQIAGTLDTTYGGANGLLAENVFAMVTQTDGKTLVVGQTVSTLRGFITRYEADGSIDTSFNGTGTYTWNNTATNSSTFYDVALQADGKIVVGAGETGSYTNGDGHLFRFNTNGTLDNTFSGDGILPTGISQTNDGITKIHIHSDGKICLAGRYVQATGSDETALGRANADGTWDSTFDNDGLLALTGFSNNGFAVQADGKYLITVDSSIMRRNTDGSIDNTFGTSGSVVVPNSIVLGTVIALQPDGKILVTATPSGGQLLRLTAAGQLDTNFGNNGVFTATTDVRFALQPNGKIVYTHAYVTPGPCSPCPAPILYLSRLSAIGVIDSAFGTSAVGSTVVSNVGSQSYLKVVHVQPNGKILVSKSVYNAGPNNTTARIQRFFGDAITAVGQVANSSISVLLYPNPTSGNLFVKTSNLNDYSIAIYNLQGQLVHQVAGLQNEITEIATADWAKGAYLVRISSKEGFSSQKFIKE